MVVFGIVIFFLSLGWKCGCTDFVIECSLFIFVVEYDLNCIWDWDWDCDCTDIDWSEFAVKCSLLIECEYLHLLPKVHRPSKKYWHNICFAGWDDCFSNFDVPPDVFGTADIGTTSWILKQQE